MTKWTASRHEEVQGRTCGLLITLAPQLPAATVGIVDELIDANECGVAVEIMSEMLVESGGVISEQTLSEDAFLIDEMGLDQLNVERLRPPAET